MMKKFVRVAPIACFYFVLSGCSALHDAIFERESRLAPLESAVLSRTTREEVIKQLGFPQEIDKRWFDAFESEVFFYYDESMSNDDTRRIRYKFLMCEFRKGVLNGYSFHESGEAGQKGFEAKERSKLVNGKTTQREVQALLGIPSSKALLPTTITLAALDLRIAGAPFPLVHIPEGTEEVWQYYSQNFDDAFRKTSQKSLSLFFDAKGTLIGSSLLQELIGKSR